MLWGPCEEGTAAFVAHSNVPIPPKFFPTYPPPTHPIDPTACLFILSICFLSCQSFLFVFLERVCFFPKRTLGRGSVGSNCIFFIASASVCAYCWCRRNEEWCSHSGTVGIVLNDATVEAHLTTTASTAAQTTDPTQRWFRGKEDTMSTCEERGTTLGATTEGSEFVMPVSREGDRPSLVDQLIEGRKRAIEDAKRTGFPVEPWERGQDMRSRVHPVSDANDSDAKESSRSDSEDPREGAATDRYVVVSGDKVFVVERADLPSDVGIEASDDSLADTDDVRKSSKTDRQSEKDIAALAPQFAPSWRSPRPLRWTQRRSAALAGLHIVSSSSSPLCRRPPSSALRPSSLTHSPVEDGAGAATDGCTAVPLHSGGPVPQSDLVVLRTGTRRLNDHTVSLMQHSLEDEDVVVDPFPAKSAAGDATGHTDSVETPKAFSTRCRRTARRVYVGGILDVCLGLHRRPEMQSAEEKLRHLESSAAIFASAATWAPGQLADEVREGAWIPTVHPDPWALVAETREAKGAATESTNIGTMTARRDPDTGGATDNDSDENEDEDKLTQQRSADRSDTPTAAAEAAMDAVWQRLLGSLGGEYTTMASQLPKTDIVMHPDAPEDYHPDIRVAMAHAVGDDSDGGDDDSSGGDEE